MTGMLRGLAAALITALVVGGLALAQTPVPGSEGDPIVTKSYVDVRAVWDNRKVETGAFFKLKGGCEFVVVSAGNADRLPLSEANLAESVVFDLTTGERVQDLALQVGHHFLVAAGNDARLTFAGSGTVMTRGLELE